MLNFLYVAITFASLCAICVFLTRVLNIPSGATPFIVLSSAIVLLTFLGCIGFLGGGAILFYIIGAASAIYCVITRNKACAERVLTPAFLLFLLSSIGLLVLIATRKPLMLEWDEYSLWGMAVKISADKNVLFPAVQTGFPWAVSQKPGLIVLSYLFNFLGNYEPWRIYFGYDILMISAFSAACAGIVRRKWNIAVPIFIACAVLPFIGIYTRMIYLVTPYINSYADIPMGIVMGGVFALYFALCRKKDKRLCLLPAIALATLTLCKDTGLPLALLCAAIISADILFLQRNDEFVLCKQIRGVWAKLVIFASYIGSIGISYIVWNKYLDTLGLVSNGLGGESNMTPFELVLNGVLMLLGLDPMASGVAFVDKFVLVRDNMITNFFDSRITLFGTGVMVFAVVIALLLIAYNISSTKLLRRRITLWGVLGCLGFFPYYAFIGFTYVFIFKGESGVNLIDYNRYMNCYYVALLIGAIALLAKALNGETRLVTFKRGAIMLAAGMIIPIASFFHLATVAGRKLPYGSDFYVPFGILIMLLFAAVYGHFKNISVPISILFASLILFMFGKYAPRQLTFIDYPDAAYSDILNVENTAKKINEAIPAGSNVFYVSSDDNQGKYWFMYHYYLYPSVLDYSWGGGGMHDCARVGDADGNWHMYITQEQLAAYLYESDNEYLFLRSNDNKFMTSYSELFEGDIVAGLYKIEKLSGAVITSEVPDTHQTDRPANIIVSQPQIRVMQNPDSYLKLTLVKETSDD